MFLLIETLGSVSYDSASKKKTNLPGRRLVCHPDKQIYLASGKTITAEELFLIMRDIPGRQEYLLFDYDGVRYPEEYRVMAPNGQLLAKVMTVCIVEVNKWTTCSA